MTPNKDVSIANKENAPIDVPATIKIAPICEFIFFIKFILDNII